MKFSNEQAASLGLVVGGKSGTALVNPVQGFAGRRIYVDGGSKKLSIPGPLVHLSGFTAEECEQLGATMNVHDEYSSRVTGFLQVTPANLAAAAKIVREATSPAREPTKKVVLGVDMNALFAAASKETEEKPAKETEQVDGETAAA